MKNFVILRKEKEKKLSKKRYEESNIMGMECGREKRPAEHRKRMKAKKKINKLLRKMKCKKKA